MIGKWTTAMILKSWYLIADSGDAFTGQSFTANFTVTPPGLSSQTHSLKLSAAPLRFDGYFTAAYAYGYVSDSRRFQR